MAVDFKSGAKHQSYDRLTNVLAYCVDYQNMYLNGAGSLLLKSFTYKLFITAVTYRTLIFVAKTIPQVFQYKSVCLKRSTKLQY